MPARAHRPEEVVGTARARAHETEEVAGLARRPGPTHAPRLLHYIGTGFKDAALVPVPRVVPVPWMVPVRKMPRLV